MPTINQLIKAGSREAAGKAPALQRSPQKRESVPASTRRPKKPNSPLRKVAACGYGGIEVTAYIPGVGQPAGALGAHPRGRVKISRVCATIIRGTLGSIGVQTAQSRSKYGRKGPMNLPVIDQ